MKLIYKKLRKNNNLTIAIFLQICYNSPIKLSGKIMNKLFFITSRKILILLFNALAFPHI